MKISRIRNLIAAPGPGSDGEDAIYYYMTSTVASISVDENGTPFTPELEIEVSEWMRIGKAAATKSSDLTLVLYTVKAGVKTSFGQSNWAPTAKFKATTATGCECIQAELTNSTGEIVATLSIPVVWQGKTGQDGVTYEILPSVASIRADKDGKILTGIIQVSAYKIEGGKRTSCGVEMQIASDTATRYWVQYRIDNSGTWTDCRNLRIVSGYITLMAYGVPASAVSSIINGISFRLLHGTSSSYSVVNETAALQVIRDGQTGAQGKTGRFYYFDGYFVDNKEYKATDYQAPYIAYDWTDNTSLNLQLIR